MDPDLIALLARLGELSAEELDDLGRRLDAYFQEVDEAGPGGDDVPEAERLTDDEHADLLLEIATARRSVTDQVAANEQAAEAAEREQAERQAAVEARREEARRIVAGDPAPEADPEADPADPVVEATPEPVAAAARTTPTRTAPQAARIRRAGALGTMRPPATATPDETADNGPRVTSALIASSDVRGFAAGTELASWDRVGAALVSKLQGLGHAVPGGDDQLSVATFRKSYPADYQLREDDPQGNLERLDRATAPGSALVAAAGGLCGPLPVDYSIPEIGDLTRPFRDSKVSFNAARGGITTNVQPVLTQADAGVGFWTLANDADPNNAAATGVPVGERLAAKPVVEFDCGTSRTSYVYAVTLRTRFNNIRARFNPETVASNARMGMVSHARLAELQLMRLQVALSTAVTSAALLGASKDFFYTLDGVTTRMRYRQRRAANTPLRATMPSWVLAMLRADFVQQMPAHNTPSEQYAVADATIAAFFRARNVNPVWMQEDMDSQAAGGIGVVQPAGALLDFPDTFRWFLEYEGEVVFLDGGELDLGVVRDSALNAVNKYETFYETFEGLHFKGAEAPLVITSTLNPNGSAAGLVATATGNATADR